MKRLGKFLCQAVQILSLLTICIAPAHALEENFGHPIYNPETKSYFELRGDNSEGYWQKALTRARALSYKGARGRLAVIKSSDTHAFLSRTFRIKEETWIGLQYWCKYRKLLWITGELHDRTAFAPWSSLWERPDPIAPCESAATIRDGFMPIYYLSHSQGFRWQAVGSGKGFKRYFVEYPTGGE